MSIEKSMDEVAAQAGTEQKMISDARICDGIMQATDVMLVYLDPDFNFLAVNPAYAATCKMQPEEMIGKNHFELYPNPENEMIFRQVRDSGEAVFYKDKPFEFPDQPERGITYWDWSLVPTKDKAGAVEGLVFSLRETTRYKLLELALRSSEEQYRSLFDGMLNAFCFCEMIFNEKGEPVDYRFLETNRAFETMSGYADVVGKRVTEIIPGVLDAHQEMFAAYGRVAVTGVPEKFEIHFTPTDRWFDVSAYCPQKGFVAILFENITERKLVEQTLRENAEKERTRAMELEAIMAAVPAAVLISLDAEYRQVVGNPAAYELLRVTPDSNLSKSGLGEAVAHFKICRQGSELLPEELPLYRAAVKGETLLGFTLDLVFDDGDRVSIYGNAVPRRDHAGRVTGAVAAFIDISSRVRAEEALLLAKQEAEAANRAKGSFVANMSHEIRTPLTGMLGMLNRLGETSLDPRQEEYRAMAETSGKTLLRVINDILDFSRMEEGKMDIVSSPFDLRECLQGTVNMFGSAAEQKQLDLSLVCPAELATEVTGDCDRLRQLMFNLIGNAVKFTDRGSVRVSVQRPDPGQPELYRIAVADTGPGIPAEKQEDIFDSFFQLDGGFSRHHAGSGLGLAISRHLAKLMGGELSVDSKVGRGSTFAATLPLPSAAPDARPGETQGQGAMKPATAAKKEGYRVLVVEDDPIITKLLKLVLLDQGYRVELAQNGIEALECWNKKLADLILMDVQMPLMDGLEAIARIRQAEGGTGEHIPIISLTAHAFEEDFQRCLDVGADAYLCKPLNFEELATVIERLLK